jgi:acyl-coenzyme A thioesterase PaaI-like protein
MSPREQQGAQRDAARERPDAAGGPPATPAQTPAQQDGGEQSGDLRGTPNFLEYWNRLDAVNWMGVRIATSEDGHAVAYFEPEKHHRGAGVGGRAVTGATQAYIFDFVTGAAVSSLTHGLMPQVTVQLDCRYHHPAYDAPLTFEARVQTAGRHVVYVEATCTDANGRVCSRANAVYYRFERRPAPSSPGEEPSRDA